MDIDFAKGGGLVPAIVQDVRSRRVLMTAWMNEEAFRRSAATGKAVFFSRSRKALWNKGERSGHTMRIAEMRTDCDGDTVLLRVEMSGAGACHQGYRSCFHRRVGRDGTATSDARKVFDPARVYGKRDFS